jgi:hypothetical protein
MPLTLDHLQQKEHTMPEYHFQTWSGEDYETKVTSTSRKDALQNIRVHMRSMPNCPARIVKVETTDWYMPKKSREGA